jgi:hypothetical protein
LVRSTATAQPDATRVGEQGKREMRAVRLTRRERADSLPDHTKGKVPSLLVQHQQGTFRARLLPVCLNLSAELRDEIALARRVNLLSALRQRFATRRIPSQDRHFTTLLNSSDPATLLPGTRHAQ